MRKKLLAVVCITAALLAVLGLYVGSALSALELDLSEQCDTLAGIDAASEVYSLVCTGEDDIGDDIGDD